MGQKRTISPAGRSRRWPRALALAAAGLWLAAALPASALLAVGGPPRGPTTPSDQPTQPAGDDLAEHADRLWKVGEYREADRVAQQGLTAARSHHDTTAHASLLEWVLRSARAAFSAGRIETAESLYSEALDSIGPVPITASRWEALRGLRDIALDRRDTEIALSRGEDCLAAGERLCGPGASGPAADLAALASAHLLADHIDAADSLIAGAIDRALAETSRTVSIGTVESVSANPCRLDSADLGTLYQEQALILLRRGRFAQAEETYRRALGLLEQDLGPNHPRITPALAGLAIVHRRQGDFAAAREAYERVLEIRSRAYGHDHPRVATALNNLGVLLDHLGEIDAAVSLLTRCLDIREAAYGEDNAEVALTLITLSSALNRQGDQAWSLRTCRRAVGICEHIFGDEHTQTARALARLAHILIQRGSTEEAAALYRRGLGITLAIQGSPHPDLSSYYASLARCHLALERLDEAEENARYAIANAAAIYGKDHYRVAIHERDLGRILLHQRRSEEARVLLEETQQVFEEALGADHPALVRVHSSLAWVRLQEGQVDEAREKASQALALSRATHGGPHLDLVGLLEMLAIIEALAGNAQESGRHAQEAAYLALQLQEDMYPVTSEHEALIYARLPRQAVHFLMGLAHAGGGASAADPAAVAAEFTLLAQMHGQVLDRMVGRQRLAADRSSTGSSKGSSTSNSAGGLWEAFGHAARRLANLTVRGPAGGRRSDQDAYREALRIAREQKQEAERALAAAGGLAEHPDPPAPPSSTGFIEKLAGTLEPGETVVQFTCFPELALSEEQWDRQERRPDLTSFETGRQRYAAFCLSHPAESWPGPDAPPTALVRLVDLGPAAPIDSLIRVYRDAVETVPSHTRPTAREEADYRRVARQLHERIWRPLDLDAIQPSSWVAEGMPALTFVIPDGWLHLIDFNTLMSEASRLVIEDHRVHWLSSARDLLRIRTDADRSRADRSRTDRSPAKQRPSRGILVVGNPTHPAIPQASPSEGSSSSATHDRGSRPPLCGDLLMELPPLPGAKAEAVAVAATFAEHTGEPATVLLGQEADEESALHHVPGKRALHFACHGFYCNEYSEASPLPDSDREPSDGAVAETVLQNPLLASGLVLAKPADARRRAWPADTYATGDEEHDGLLTAEEIASLDLADTEWVVLGACGSGLGSLRPGEGLFGLRRAFELAGAQSVVMALWRVGDRPAADLMTRVHELHWNGKSTVDAVRGAALERLEEQRRRFGRVHPAAWGGIITEGDWR